MITLGNNIWKGSVDVLVDEYIYEEPIRQGHTTTYSCWDFEKTPYYEWLLENASKKWDWDFVGVEDERGRITCRIQFESLEDLMAFKLTWAEKLPKN